MEMLTEMCEGMSFLPPETLILYDPKTMPPISPEDSYIEDESEIQLSKGRSDSLPVIQCHPVERRRSPRLASQCSPVLGVRRSSRIAKNKS